MSRYLLLMLLVIACKRDGSSEIKENIYGKYIWYKTPAEIKATIDNLGINIPSQENELFIDLGLAYGGTNTHGQILLGERPTVLYTLAIAKVAWRLSGIFTSYNQLDPQGQAIKHLFATGIAAPDTQNCFADTSQQWCDYDDQLEIDTYNNTKELTAADRKKIMHNMQDIGDALGVIIDNLSTMEGYNHVPHYLLEEVFIPNLNEGGDREAWQAVIYAIMLRGPFFMHLEADSQHGGML